MPGVSPIHARGLGLLEALDVPPQFLTVFLRGGSQWPPLRAPLGAAGTGGCRTRTQPPSGLLGLRILPFYARTGAPQPATRGRRGSGPGSGAGRRRRRRPPEPGPPSGEPMRNFLAAGGAPPAAAERGAGEAAAAARSSHCSFRPLRAAVGAGQGRAAPGTAQPSRAPYGMGRAGPGLAAPTAMAALGLRPPRPNGAVVLLLLLAVLSCGAAQELSPRGRNVCRAAG